MKYIFNIKYIKKVEIKIIALDISLCSGTGKLFSKLVTNHLIKKLNEKHGISEKQAGFRQDNCTSDQIFILKP